MQLASIRHPFVIVMTADCDLLWDFRARPATDPGAAALLLSVIVCDLYEGPVLRQRFTGASDLWRRVSQNQDERYHHLNSAGIVDSESQLVDFYVDFKKAFGLAPEAVYQGMDSNQVRRLAVMPPIYMHDLMHRFYAFASRVALPD